MSNQQFDYVRDYESKVQYLKDHFTRLWTRFNFFLTLQSALFGAAILSPEKYHWWVPIFGILLSILWYIFGAQDRYLVALYRKQIEEAWDKIKPDEKYWYIGQTEKLFLRKDNPEENIRNAGIENKIYQWRSDSFSTTKLAALFPVVILVMWLAILLLFVGENFIGKT